VTNDKDTKSVLYIKEENIGVVTFLDQAGKYKIAMWNYGAFSVCKKFEEPMLRGTEGLFYNKGPDNTYIICTLKTRYIAASEEYGRIVCIRTDTGVVPGDFNPPKGFESPHVMTHELPEYNYAVAGAGTDEYDTMLVVIDEDGTYVIRKLEYTDGTGSIALGHLYYSDDAYSMAPNPTIYNFSSSREIFLGKEAIFGINMELEEFDFAHYHNNIPYIAYSQLA
jgi:hypothetical protein